MAHPDRALAAIVLSGIPMLLSCVHAVEHRDLGGGYAIRTEPKATGLPYGSPHWTLLFNDQVVTYRPYVISPSKRFVFYTDFGNWYLFDSIRQRPRFLHSATFDCTVKFYEDRTPSFLRCFDVFGDQMAEFPLE